LLMRLVRRLSTGAVGAAVASVAAASAAARATGPAANESFGIMFEGGDARSCADAVAVAHEHPDHTMSPAVTNPRRSMIAARAPPGCHRVRSLHASAVTARRSKGKACASVLGNPDDRKHRVFTGQIRSFRTCQSIARLRDHEVCVCRTIP